MSYGYDSAVAFGRSTMQLADFAVDLLNRLHDERKDLRCGRRPLIFICHGLGGVVFKQALITASAPNSCYVDILNKTYGVVFMGTPHRGSCIASPARHLSRIINAVAIGAAVRSDLLDLLEITSAQLESISQLSIPLLDKLSIVSFYERKPLGPSLVRLSREPK